MNTTMINPTLITPALTRCLTPLAMLLLTTVFPPTAAQAGISGMNPKDVPWQSVHYDASRGIANLTVDITETEESGSPLNLIDQLPQTAALLEAKLDRWLEDVDALMPYQVWDDIELRWDAGQPGQDPDAWRSVVDVQHYFREAWEVELGATNGPTHVDAAPYQPEAPGPSRTQVRYWRESERNVRRASSSSCGVTSSDASGAREEQ